MRNIENALTDVVDSYRSGEIWYEIVEYIPSETRWIVNVYNRLVPNAFIQIEVIDDNGVPVCSVLSRVNVGRRSMTRLMNRLMFSLETPQNDNL
jgi:hypothetical protein